MLSSRLQRSISVPLYAFFVLIIIVASGLSCAALISQAVRTSPTRSWKKNVNALMIGGSYVVVLVASVLFSIKRRVLVRLQLQRISKTYRTVERKDLPQRVHRYVIQEYIRTCLVAYESLPKEQYHDGWGRPGTEFSGQQFRRVLLDTIAEIDEVAHIVIRRHPTLKPHARMLHHFRFLTPLLPEDEYGMTPLHYYDSAIQLARHSRKELTEDEFRVGMEAAEQIKQSLNECRAEMEMLESSESTTQLVPEARPL